MLFSTAHNSVCADLDVKARSGASVPAYLGDCFLVQNLHTVSEMTWLQKDYEGTGVRTRAVSELLCYARVKRSCLGHYMTTARVQRIDAETVLDILTNDWSS